MLVPHLHTVPMQIPARLPLCLWARAAHMLAVVFLSLPLSLPSLAAAGERSAVRAGVFLLFPSTRAQELKKHTHNVQCKSLPVI